MTLSQIVAESVYFFKLVAFLKDFDEILSAYLNLTLSPTLRSAPLLPDPRGLLGVHHRARTPPGAPLGPARQHLGRGRLGENQIEN